jgi:ATP synthase protein I
VNNQGTTRVFLLSIALQKNAFTELTNIVSFRYNDHGQMGDMDMSQPKWDDNPWRAMGLIGAVGTELAVCVGSGYYIGDRIGRWLGYVTTFTLIGVLLGLAAGGLGVYYLIRRFTGGSDG